MPSRGPYKPLLDELGITYPQYIVLVALSMKTVRTIGSIADRGRHRLAVKFLALWKHRKVSQGSSPIGTTLC